MLRLIAPLVATVALALGLGSPARGAVFLVDSTADEIDASPGDGLCASGSGVCTLRAAVIEANATVGPDVIEIPAGDYGLTIPGLGEDQAATGDIDVFDELVIRGLGGVADDVVLHGDWREPNDIGRVFHGQLASRLTVQRLTISDTWAGYDSDEGAGAAIRSDGDSLVLEDSFFARNIGYSISPGGGAVYASTPAVAVARSRFFNNRSVDAAGDGGAIQARDLSVEDSIFIGNVADDGGAIEVEGLPAELIVRRSQFIGNATSDVGAAVSGGGTLEDSLFDANWTQGGLVVTATEIRSCEFRDNDGGFQLLAARILRDSLVTNNDADEMFGSAIAVINSTISGNRGEFHPAVIEFSTIADNVWPFPTTLSGLRIRASLIVGNSAAGQPLACGGTTDDFTSDGYNLIDIADNCAPTATDAFGTSAAPLDVRVAPLADNGGPTRTHALLAGSPAIDWVPTADCVVDDDGDPGTAPVPLAIDQREVQRPQRAGCDAGAYEAGPPACSDGIDNDGDGRADYPFDPGCTDSADDDESAPDSDGDGVEDPIDNCLHFANASQSDVGGIGASAGADGIGDACQCGDVTGDGSVTTTDAVLITRALLVPPTATLARPDLCDVGGSSACSTADAVIVTRALLVPSTATVRQSCAPAIP